MSGSEVAEGLAAVRRRIAAACERAGRAPDSVGLVAVSKRHPVARIRDALAAGQRDFGENRVQELMGKAPDLAAAAGLRWHMIGSVQTNKVRQLLAVPGLALLHSLDRAGLADALQKELDRRAAAEPGASPSLDALLQINATGEAQKHGCRPEDAAALLEHVQRACPRIAVTGLMAMGPLDGDPAPVFERVARLRDELRSRSGAALPVLSLGMSGDLEAAIAAGSTLVRVGTAVFGARS